MEHYLKTLSTKNKKTFVKFRTANHHLPVESGRWNVKSISERLCTLCNSGQTGDEFHFIFRESKKKIPVQILLPKSLYYQIQQTYASSQKENVGKTLLF